MYIATCGEFCKVGYAVEVKRRISNINLAFPPIFVIALYKQFLVPPGGNPQLIEFWSHYFLKKFWGLKGEWFKVRPRVAEQAIRKAIRQRLNYEPPWTIRSEQSKALWKSHGPVMAAALQKKWKDPEYRDMMFKVLKANRDNWSKK